jgi:phosphoribosylformylglycinamidine synthase
VLGAGQGWAKSVLLHGETRREFQAFFERKDTFTLGVCNGCQFLSRLREIIPGAANWPAFERNRSEQYEARVVMVEVVDGPTSHDPEGAPSIFLHGMQGSKLPIVVAHGEGRASWEGSSDQLANANKLYATGQVSLRYVDNRLEETEMYPFNPNGSPRGVTGVRSQDGRVLAMMPHPERTILRDVASYRPDKEGMEKSSWSPDYGPWIRLFYSARRWVG